MDTLRLEFFPGGLPKIVVLQDGDDLIEANFAITTHRIGETNLLLQTVDVSVNGDYKEHYSVSSDGKTIHIFGLKDDNASFQYELDGPIDADALNKKLAEGTIHSEQPDDFFKYLEKVRTFLPTPQNLIGDSEIEVDDFFPGTSPGDNITAAVGLICLASPIATAACMVGVAIVFYSQKAH